MFRPWIGPDWGQPSNVIGGLRLMVLGESHYSSHHEPGSVAPEMTEWVVDAYFSGDADGAIKQFCSRIAELVRPAARDGATRRAHGRNYTRRLHRVSR